MSELPHGDEGLEGRYSNHFQIGFNAYEFVIDFGQEYPPDAARIHTRIVTSPQLVRRLSETLDRSLRDHESKYRPRKDGE